MSSAEDVGPSWGGCRARHAAAPIGRLWEREDETFDLDEVLGRYSEKVMLAAHVAPRLVRGLFVMTAHQSKGKEFDGVVFADVSERYWPDDADTRRLFYVAVTRATTRWTIVAPDRGESPLLRHLTDE